MHDNYVLEQYYCTQQHHIYLFGNKTKRDVEFRHSTRIRSILKKGKRDVLTLG